MHRTDRRLDEGIEFAVQSSTPVERRVGHVFGDSPCSVLRSDLIAWREFGVDDNSFKPNTANIQALDVGEEAQRVGLRLWLAQLVGNRVPRRLPSFASCDPTVTFQPPHHQQQTEV